MLTSTLSINLNVLPQFLYFIVQHIKCTLYSFFITNLPKIKTFFQIKKPINKFQLAHHPIKEWNILVFRSVFLSILIGVAMGLFPARGVATAGYSLHNTCWASCWSWMNSFLRTYALTFRLLELLLSCLVAIRLG